VNELTDEPNLTVNNLVKSVRFTGHIGGVGGYVPSPTAAVSVTPRRLTSTSTGATTAGRTSSCTPGGTRAAPPRKQSVALAEPTIARHRIS
jgi:hypothetical protein